MWPPENSAIKIKYLQIIITTKTCCPLFETTKRQIKLASDKTYTKQN